VSDSKCCSAAKSITTTRRAGDSQPELNSTLQCLHHRTRLPGHAAHRDCGTDSECHRLSSFSTENDSSQQTSILRSRTSHFKALKLQKNLLLQTLTRQTLHKPEALRPRPSRIDIVLLSFSHIIVELEVWSVDSGVKNRQGTVACYQNHRQWLFSGKNLLTPNTAVAPAVTNRDNSNCNVTVPTVWLPKQTNNSLGFSKHHWTRSRWV
jgi:hypothetical protein